MGEEVKEMVYSAANLVFIAAVLFVAIMFFGLRADYANTVAERLASEKRIEMENKFREYDFAQVIGYDVISAITTYSKETPVYVTGAYNFVNGDTNENLIYDATSANKGTPWGDISTSVDPRTDEDGFQAIYRKESKYFAILTYDSDSPDQLVRDLGFTDSTGREAGSGHNDSVAAKIKWVTDKYNAVRPNGHNGYTVSGVLFVCLDLEGVPEDSIAYKGVAIH